MRIYEDFIDNLGQLEIVQKEDSETGQSDPADYYFIYPLPPDDKVQRQVRFVLEKNPGVIEYKLFEKQKRYEHSDLREDVFAFDTDFKSPVAALNFIKQILFAQFGDFSDGYDVVFQSPNANYILNAKTLRKIFIDGSYKTINVETPNRMYKMLPNLLYEMCCCEMMKKCYEVVDDLFKCSVNLIYQSHPSNNIQFSQDVRKFFWDRPINTETFDDDLLIYMVNFDDGYNNWRLNNMHGKSYQIGNETIEPNFLKKINGTVPKNVLFDYNKKLGYPFLTLYLGIFPYNDITGQKYYYTFLMCNNSLKFSTLYEKIKSIYGLEELPESFTDAIKKEYKNAK